MNVINFGTSTTRVLLRLIWGNCLETFGGQRRSHDFRIVQASRGLQRRTGRGEVLAAWICLSGSERGNWIWRWMVVVCLEKRVFLVPEEQADKSFLLLD